MSWKRRLPLSALIVYDAGLRQASQSHGMGGMGGMG